jgi:hypothetical protein
MPSASFVACVVLALSASAAVLLVATDRIDGDGSLYRWTSARTDLINLTEAVKLLARERGMLPSDAEGLPALVTGEPKYLDKLPNDPWLRPYVYRRIASAPGFEIYSVGQNGKDDFGKGDDIVSWDKSYRCEDYTVGCLVTVRQLPLLSMVLLMLGSLAVIGYRAATSSGRYLRARLR